MEILLSTYALERFGDQIRSAAPEATLVTPKEGSTPRPSVAWLSTDLFYSSEAGRFYEIVAASPMLAWLQSSAAGVDLPIYRSLLERGAMITSSHANSLSIAEFVLGSVLRVKQRPEAWADAQRRHAWEHHEFDEIAGTTWLIIGFGAIGQAIGTRARSFGATVLGVRRSPGAHPAADEMITPDELVDRLGEADVVVLCRPGNPDGSPFFDADLLQGATGLPRVREACDGHLGRLRSRAARSRQPALRPPAGRDHPARLGRGSRPSPAQRRPLRRQPHRLP